MWERGLKLYSLTLCVSDYMSLPMWERGLKRLQWEVLDARDDVAPHVGAWIETPRKSHIRIIMESLPMWERGLKHRGQGGARPSPRVAPHVGAWIETLQRSFGI